MRCQRAGATLDSPASKGSLPVNAKNPAGHPICLRSECIANREGCSNSNQFAGISSVNTLECRVPLTFSR